MGGGGIGKANKAIMMHVGGNLVEFLVHIYWSECSAAVFLNKIRTNTKEYFPSQYLNTRDLSFNGISYARHYSPYLIRNRS